MMMVNVAKPQKLHERALVCGGLVAQLDHLFVAAPQRGAAVVEKGHAVARHA
jgi:hypothetical protein